MDPAAESRWLMIRRSRAPDGSDSAGLRRHVVAKSPLLPPLAGQPQPTDQSLDASDRGGPNRGIPGRIVPIDHLQDPAGQPQDLVDPGPTDVGQQVLPWPDPAAEILMAEMPVAVAADRAARGLEGRQQVLEAGGVRASADERRQRGIVRGEGAGGIAQRQIDWTMSARSDSAMIWKNAGAASESRSATSGLACSPR